ncbi:MAG: MogA/MoaB family molybdenum cofactor biosynthesis protein [Bacteroidales bacterium]|jgi:molybdenum cofactor synthesis domain-containing protein
MNFPEKLEILVITLSDRAYHKEYNNLSGPRLKERLTEYFKNAGQGFNISMTLIPDDALMLKELIQDGSAFYNIIFTTGGTGIGPRDTTIETVRPMLSKEIPGIMEFIRVKYGMENPDALLSRSVAGIIGKSIVYTLPGSVKAVDEYLDEILKTIRHTIMMQYGIDMHGNQ